MDFALSTRKRSGSRIEKIVRPAGQPPTFRAIKMAPHQVGGRRQSVPKVRVRDDSNAPGWWLRAKWPSRNPRAARVSMEWGACKFTPVRIGLRQNSRRRDPLDARFSARFTQILVMIQNSPQDRAARIPMWNSVARMLSTGRIPLRFRSSIIHFWTAL